jgi:flagellar motor switch protein FliM
MGEILKPDQIEALLEAAKSGQLPEHAAATSRRRQRVRTVDFSRPTKFTSDHQRKISRAIDTFCQTAATRLSAELRWPIELEAINTTQVTWSAAQGLLPGHSLSAMLEVHPINTRMLLIAEQAFVLTTVECLLGGSPDRPPRERRLTEIDWSLTRRIFDALVTQLSLVWQDLGGVTFGTVGIDLHNDTGQIAPVSEPTLVVVIESRINDPIQQRISGREHFGVDDVAQAQDEMQRALAAVPVTLRAEVAAVDLPVNEILGLSTGSVIRLGKPAGRGVALFAENTQLGHGVPGANGARRAVQVRDVRESSA